VRALERLDARVSDADTPTGGWCLCRWNGINDPHFSAYAGLLSVLETSLVLQDVSTFEWAAQKLDAALDSVTAAGLMANTTSNRKMLLVQSAGVLTYVAGLTVLTLCDGVPAAVSSLFLVVLIGCGCHRRIALIIPPHVHTDSRSRQRFWCTKTCGTAPSEST